jgi:hypothetical protein
LTLIYGYQVDIHIFLYWDFRKITKDRDQRSRESQSSHLIACLLNLNRIMKISENVNTYLRNEVKRAEITLFFYILTLLLSRLIVFLIELDLDIPFLGYNTLTGFHIHHYTYGIILLCLISFYALFVKLENMRFNLYILYGVSLGLIFDEFGIWLKLDPEYNQRISFIAAGVVALILVLVTVYPRFFVRTDIKKMEEEELELSGDDDTKL